MRSNDEDPENEESGGPGFITGLLVGTAIGAVAALLFAPKSGEEIRHQLKSLAEDQKDTLKNKWDLAKEKAGDVVNSARDRIDSAAQQASGSVDAYAEKAVDKVIQLAEDTKSTVDKFKKGNDESLRPH